MLVATDAIGMGLNLNIRRVVFHATTKSDGVRRRRSRLDRDHLDGHEAFNTWMSDGGHCGQDAFNTAPRGGRGRAAESGLARVLREGRVGGSVRHVERAIRESARARHRASLITSYNTMIPFL